MSVQEIVDPCFFLNEQGQSVTINYDRYITMLREFFFPQLHEFEAYNNRQDGATCLTSKESLAVVNEMFEGKLISP